MEKYTLLKVLGKGSFGAAWLINRKDDGSQFVAKEIRLAGLKQAEKENAKHEIDVLSRLHHPNITRYVEHFEHRGSLFIVMEYADGGDLYTKVKSQKGKLLSEKQVLFYFSQICLALGYLHERRILHRDLKSQNVFLTKDGVVKLGDFGISTVLRNTCELRRTVCGTPYYFSPELCLNKPYNNKSDVWALGCILYELTTLTHAFDGPNMRALVQKILKGVYPPIHPSYSSNLSKLISGMLQLDPLRRPNVTQIMELPFVMESLLTLRKEVQGAIHNEVSVVPIEEKQRQQQEAEDRREAYKKRQKEKAERQADQWKKERTLQEQRQKDYEVRKRRIEEQQQLQLQQFEEKRRDMEKRVKDQRKELDRRGKLQAEHRRQREDGWNMGMGGQDPQPAHPAPPRDAALPGGASPHSPAHPSAAEVYHEMRRQAALNKQRCIQAEGGVTSPLQPAEPLSPVNRVDAVTAKEHLKPPLSPKAMRDARAEAFWNMRQEAAKNKRRLMGLDEGAEDPNPAPPPRAEEPEEDCDDDEGEEGLHAFLNGEAAAAEKGDEGRRREEDYGALETAIGNAILSIENRKPAEDFDDLAAPESQLDPTKFMLDGRTLLLPNTEGSNSLMLRVETLRYFLETEMGEENLKSCYKKMNNIAEDDDDAMQGVSSLLPQAELQRFIPLIAQLIVCEDVVNCRQHTSKPR